MLTLTGTSIEALAADVRRHFQGAGEKTVMYLTISELMAPQHQWNRW